MSFLVGCTELPCLENANTLTSVIIENGGHKWNCGMKSWECSEVDLPKFCNMFSQLERVKKPYVRSNNWVLDLYINGEQDQLFKNDLELIHTFEDGFVSNLREKYFVQKELAEYILLKLEITNSDSKLVWIS